MSGNKPETTWEKKMLLLATEAAKVTRSLCTLDCTRRAASVDTHGEKDKIATVLPANRRFCASSSTSLLLTVVVYTSTQVCIQLRFLLSE